MSQTTSSHTLEQPVDHGSLPLLLVLFIGSGCSALIYEIVWFQLLQLVIGSSAVSLGVLLGTFMGGMCLGSLLLPRLIGPRRHPLRVYALLELGIGIMGVAILSAMPSIDRMYAESVGPGFASILLRAGVCAICLLPPTLLMGATLPAIARLVESTPRGTSWLGFFYGGNIAGAVFGCLLAGFYLLRIYDMATATYVAAALNLSVAVAAFILAALMPHRAPAAGAVDVALPAAPSVRSAYFAIALSGLCALGAEVIWTRLLSLMLGATVYTFSIILAVFLIGLGIGSSIGAAIARGRANPRFMLGLCQLALTGGVAWAAYMLARSLPYWPIDPSLSRNPWLNFQLDLVRCAWVVLPPAMLWGASFPLALGAASSQGKDPGRVVGGIYAANTVGAIIGAVGFSILVIPHFGTQQSQRILVAVSALAAIIMFVPLLRSARIIDPLAVSSGRFFSRAVALLGILLATAAGVSLAWSVAPIPWELIAYGRYATTRIAGAKLLYEGEGMNSSVAVTELAGGIRNFHVSGKVEASSEPLDMRLQRMMGHIPALLHRNPRSVLVVGCGAGVTAGSFVLYPGVERIVICEIEPLIPQAIAKKYFAAENYSVVTDKRVEIVYDDARHYILTTKEKFDVITSDPIHPWVKGAATLYTKEYFELCKQHLNPGGIVAQWVPLYESTTDTVKSEVRTFFEAFPAGMVWSNDASGEGYDTVLLGQAQSEKLNVDELVERLNRPDYSEVADSLRQVGFQSAVELLATYAGSADDLRPWLRGAEVNRDANLRLQYLAGMGLNLYQSERIFDEMLECRTFPAWWQISSSSTAEALKTEMAKTAMRRIASH